MDAAYYAGRSSAARVPQQQLQRRQEGGAGTMVETRRRYTVDEWLDSPENAMLTELVEGVPVERIPTTWDHGQVVKVLWRWLDRAEQAGYGSVGLGPVAVVLDASGGRRNVREPDLCFVRRDREHIITGKAIEGVPDLVIEVLSLTNRSDDLPGGPVWNDYERFAVPDYWIVDPEEGAVAQYHHEGLQFGAPTVLQAGDTLHHAMLSDITLPVAGLFPARRGPGQW
jgi:Uma2 family endonuclease